MLAAGWEALLSAVQGKSRWEEKRVESCSTLLGLENKTLRTGSRVLTLKARYGALLKQPSASSPIAENELCARLV